MRRRGSEGSARTGSACPARLSGRGFRVVIEGLPPRKQRCFRPASSPSQSFEMPLRSSPAGGVRRGALVRYAGAGCACGGWSASRVSWLSAAARRPDSPRERRQRRRWGRGRERAARARAGDRAGQAQAETPAGGGDVGRWARRFRRSGRRRAHRRDRGVRAQRRDALQARSRHEGGHGGRRLPGLPHGRDRHRPGQGWGHGRDDVRRALRDRQDDGCLLAHRFGRLPQLALVRARRDGGCERGGARRVRGEHVRANRHDERAEADARRR